MSKLLFLGIALLLVMGVGCTVQVPPGYKGKVLAVDGFKGDTLNPGRHSCWGRDKMVLMEGTEKTFEERLSILCRDDLNFKFDTYTRVTPRKELSFDDVVSRMGAPKFDGDVAVVSLEAMYVNFARPIIRSVARGIVSKYSTTDIRENREKIEADLIRVVNEKLMDTPLVVKMINTSNFDYPDVITKSVEQKRSREIEIDEEKAAQKKRLLEAENKLRIEEMNYKIETLKAKTVADSIKVIAGSLAGHPEYLEWHRVQNVAEAAKGPNNTFIFSEGQFSTSEEGNGKTGFGKGNKTDMLILDALKKIQKSVEKK